MPGRRLVDGHIVESEPPRISWRRVILLTLLVAGLVLTNPFYEADTARLLERLKLKNTMTKWTGMNFKSGGSPYWQRKTTNYILFTVKERIAGLEVGVANRSFHVCSWEDPDWGFACKHLETLTSFPGVKWWQLPLDQPPAVFHRLSMMLMALGCVAVACQVPIHDDPLTSMFLPSSGQNCILWLMQVFVDSNVLLFPVWERLYSVTVQQASDSPSRLAGKDDALNFYAAILILAVTAAGVRLVSGNERKYGWLIWVVINIGYWRGTQMQSMRTMQSTILDDTSEENSDLMIWMSLRLVLFVMVNGLAHVGPVLVTMLVTLFAGAAWGDYHYSHQVWQVWTSSFSSLMENSWKYMFGGSAQNNRTF